MKELISVVMIGATGAAGSQVVKYLANQESSISRITLLGRRKLENLKSENINIEQYIVDIFDSDTYRHIVNGHSVAICTLGVGEPSSVRKEMLIKVDKTSVIEFAKICKESGVKHFEILSSLGANPSASMFYLKVKGELNEALKSLNFNRLSIFQPSLIITPQNRFGFGQWLSLKLFPLLKTFMISRLRKYRGILVSELGEAIALNILSNKSGEEVLYWTEFKSLLEQKKINRDE